MKKKLERSRVVVVVRDDDYRAPFVSSSDWNATDDDGRYFHRRRLLFATKKIPPLKPLGTWK